MGIQDNERRPARQAPTGTGSGSGGIVTSLRIARIQRVAVPPEPAAATEAGSPARIESRSLFGGSREVVILHGGAEYRLRQTASGKLILTK